MDSVSMTRTFSLEGRFFQVGYAIEAIKLGTTAIGVATSEGRHLGVCVDSTEARWALRPVDVHRLLVRQERREVGIRFLG